MVTIGDLGHRVVWTFVETFCGFLVAEPLIEAIGGNVNLPLWQTAVGSALAAAIVPVKEYARQRLDRRRNGTETLGASEDYR